MDQLSKVDPMSALTPLPGGALIPSLIAIAGLSHPLIS